MISVVAVLDTFYFVRKEGEIKQAFITQQVEVQVWNDFTYIHIK